MFAIVSKEPDPKVMIFEEEGEVSEGEWGCRIQTWWVATLTSCADEISRAQTYLLSAVRLHHAEQVFYAWRLEDSTGYSAIGSILPPVMAKERMLTFWGTRSANNVVPLATGEYADVELGDATAEIYYYRGPQNLWWIDHLLGGPASLSAACSG